MTYAILLDRYVGLYGDDQYAISKSGTLADCRGQTHHDGTTLAAPKSQYTEGASEAKSLIGPEGDADPGRIVELNPTALESAA